MMKYSLKHKETEESMLPLLNQPIIKPNKATCAVNYIHANNYNVLHCYLEPCSTNKLWGPLEAAFVTSDNSRSQLIVEFWG